MIGGNLQVCRGDAMQWSAISSEYLEARIVHRQRTAVKETADKAHSSQKKVTSVLKFE